MEIQSLPGRARQILEWSFMEELSTAEISAKMQMTESHVRVEKSRALVQPVAASQFEFSVREGIFSSINVAENIGLGYNHFYAEVVRVKQAADAAASGKRLLLMFDELFKGTNVKDAYDGTLAVTGSICRIPGLSTAVVTAGLTWISVVKKRINKSRDKTTKEVKMKI